jgi:trans-2-enoyl-CoA reductase
MPNFVISHGGSFVTYGAMSRQPLTFPASVFIFKDISAHGYWMTQWMEDKRPGRKEERAQMLEELSNMLRQGTLKPPIAEQTRWGQEADLDTSLNIIRKIIAAAGASRAGRKQVILMHDVD